MGQVTFKLEADEAKAVKGFLRVVEAQNKVGRAAKDSGTKVKGATDEMDKAFGSMGANFGRQISGMVTGLVGVGGVMAALQLVRAETMATVEAMGKLAVEGGTYDRAAVAVATQMGQGATDVGHQTGRDILARIARGARTGPDVEMAKGVAIAGHAAFGSKGEVLSGKTLDMTLLGGQFAGYAQMDSGAAAGMFKVMAQAGVGDKEQMAKRLGQFYESYKGALSVDQGTAIGGVVRFMAQYMSQGGTYERGLAEFGRAVQVTGSEQEAAQMVRKTTDMFAKPTVMAALAKQMWPEDAVAADDGGGGMLRPSQRKARQQRLQKEIDDRLITRFSALSLDDQKKAFGQFVQSADRKTLMDIGLEARQAGWARSMYGGEGIEDIAAREKMLGGIGSAGVLAELDQYGRTKYAGRQDIATETALGAGLVSDPTKRGQALMELAERNRELQREGAVPNLLGWEGAIRSRRAETELTAQSMVGKRLAAVRGRVPAEEYQGAEELYGELSIGLGSLVGIPQFNQRQLGEAAAAVEKLERLAEALEKNTAATQANTNGTRAEGGPGRLNPNAQTE